MQRDSLLISKKTPKLPPELNSAQDNTLTEIVEEQMIRRMWHLNAGIESALDIALCFANFTEEKAQLDFDGFSVVVSPGQELEDVLADYYTQKAAVNTQATSSQ